MKFRILMLALALAAAAIPAHAQQTPERPHRSRDWHAGPVEKLLRHRQELGLTDEQVARITDIGRRMDELNQPLVQRLIEIRRQLHSEPKTEPSSMTAEQKEAFEKHVQEARPLMHQIRKNMHAAMEEVGEVLTPEQRTQLREMIHSKRERDGSPGDSKRRRGRGA